MASKLSMELKMSRMLFVIIRSHGVITSDQKPRQKPRVFPSSMQTCPHVARAQKAAAALADQGYSVIIVGESGTP